MWLWSHHEFFTELSKAGCSIEICTEILACSDEQPKWIFAPAKCPYCFEEGYFYTLVDDDRVSKVTKKIQEAILGHPDKPSARVTFHDPSN